MSSFVNSLVDMFYDTAGITSCWLDYKQLSALNRLQEVGLGHVKAGLLLGFLLYATT